jgi:ribosomal-protein-alanine N-acetyltransferase
MIRTEIPTLLTAHLLQRPWRLEDTSALFEIMREKDIFQYFPPSTPPTLEKAERYITHQLSHWEKFGYGHWAVETLEGELAGWNGLEFLPDTGETEVGYLLGCRFRGQGYATEAAHAAVEFSFQKAGLVSIIGLVHRDNAASIRVLEKCGLRFVDDKVYFGMELRRYRLERAEFEGKPD